MKGKLHNDFIYLEYKSHNPRPKIHDIKTANVIKLHWRQRPTGFLILDVKDCILLQTEFA